MNPDPGKALLEDIDEVTQAAFDEALASSRSKITEALFGWLSFTARKKSVDDLPFRLEQMRKRIEVLAENLELTMEAGKAVVKVTGDGASTLRMLERGTDWFDPAGDVTEMIVGAVLD